ncbi:MAG: hypothetical protein AB1847_00340 [bacterium]
MHSKKPSKWSRAGILFSLFLGLSLILFSSAVQAVPGGSGANWAALLPYNTLWPLWSPALSPVNPTTGLPTPVVSNLAPSTVLPVQPGLTWDPSRLYPWLLYNTPAGMAYYDPLFGINLWPPSYLTLGPIALPPNYANLAPTSSLWLSTFVPLANALYLKSLPKFTLPPSPVTPTTFVPPVPPVPTAPIVPTAAFVPPVPPVPTTVVPPVPPVPTTAPAATTIPLLTPSAII